MGFPTKNDHFGVFLGVPPFKETPIYLASTSGKKVGKGETEEDSLGGMTCWHFWGE